MSGRALHRWLPQQPLSWLDGLKGAPVPLLAPIRSDIFGPQRFAQHGRSLGQTHQVTLARAGVQRFFPRLADNIVRLRQAQRYVGEAGDSAYEVSPAAEWLLDNFQLIEGQLKEIHEGLPRGYFRSLPALQDPPLAGLPRVYGVAWAFVAHTDSAFDEALLVDYLCAYQDVCELQLGEMWALPTTLRVVLIENLRRLAERMAGHKAARELANHCCGTPLPPFETTALADLLERLRGRGLDQVFLAQMALRLQEQLTLSDAPEIRVYAHWVGQALPDLGTVLAQQDADAAADNLSMANAVTSLRSIGHADWGDIVGRSSTLVRQMMTSLVFAAEQAQTRDQSLHAIERLARRSGRSESDVAHAVLKLVRDERGDDLATRAPYHWLVGRGRPALLADLGLRGDWAHGLKKAGLPLYVLALVATSVACVVWLQHLGGQGHALPDQNLWATVGALLLWVPVSEAVIAMVNRLIGESVLPVPLPRLAFAQGVPKAHQVMVVIPVLLTQAAATAEVCHRLELHYLANPEEAAQFALLSDWADSPTAATAQDGALLDAALQHLQVLNQRYPRPHGCEGQAPRFILLHRARVYDDTQQCWIGWERKRGKLEQLVSALATGQQGVFQELGACSRMTPGTAHVLTLDSDTQLPPGRLRELVGVAAHPINTPQLNGTGRNIRFGHAVLQPNVATPLPTAKERTPFHWLFAGECGIDPYSAASSVIYQDVFGQGSFTGKGLLHVATTHAVLANRLPHGQVLSHDLVEGALLHCAVVSDVDVLESAALHADVAAARQHRWTRGDWQLLPLLLQPRRYALGAVSCWKLWDNLRRSLVPPAALLVLVGSLFGLGLAPALALGVVLAAFSAGPVLGALAGFSSRREHLARRYFYGAAAKDLLRSLAGGLWHLVQLPNEARLALDAIVRALYRSLVSRRQLLQWTTAAAAQAAARSTWSGLWRLHGRHSGWPVGLMALLWLWQPAHAWLGSVLCFVWALAPGWTWWISRPLPLRREALSVADQAYLRAVGRDTWHWFEQCVGPLDNHLPPDNLQTLPLEALAHRTSPTNMGLYLLSVMCARQLGWTDNAGVVARLQATLASMGKLQRHRGHFLNWYDTQSLQPLLPLYVSTVDSGNLSGHLLTTAQACLALADNTADTLWQPQLRALAAQCQHLAWEPDFAFLYHPKRRLLHIGMRVAEQELDTGFYDLLASESRLTSLLAIAKGDVPVHHWAALGRPLYAVGARVGLRSWSGSMFEYLMPTLILAETAGSILGVGCQTALFEQMDYARRQGVPWGISESAYAGRDFTLAYQYAPQGVPRLALRRTPAHELVVAPYATALAAQVLPHSAVLNLRSLEALGARQSLGFMDALDFTPERNLLHERFQPVSTFMAHHQGMTLVALTNVLCQGVVQGWGMADARIEAVASLLHERLPRELSALAQPQAEAVVAARLSHGPSLVRQLVPGVTALAPTHLLANGRYSVSLRANGAGQSCWGQVGLSRGRDDALRDAHGHFVYLRECGADAGASSALHSLTQNPAPHPQAQYQAVFHADRVCFETVWPNFHIHTTVWVCPEDDIEFRQVEIHNGGSGPLELELLSAFEVCLSDARADEAHPAFANMFVKCAWLAAHQALLFERTPRLDTEVPVHLAHFVCQTEAQVLGLSVQTDRQKWLGRNRTAHKPLGQTVPGDPADRVLDTGLDPMCVLGVRLRVPPGGMGTVTFATAASEHALTLHALLDKYQSGSNVARAALMSTTLAGIRLRALGIGAQNFTAIQTLSTALLFHLTQVRPVLQWPAHDRRGQGGVCRRDTLWRFAISGERPIVLVLVAAAQGLTAVGALAQALRLWAWAHVECDLVVINTQPPSYDMSLQRAVARLREQHIASCGLAPGLDGPVCTGFHVLMQEDLSVDEWHTLQSLARVWFIADGRQLWEHVAHWDSAHQQSWTVRQRGQASPVSLHRPDAAPPAVCSGEFVGAGGVFRFAVESARRPLRPWVNVLSNEQFGCQISEAGGGYSWAVNSRLNQLTAWSNDPVVDPVAEEFWLQDLDTSEVWPLCATGQAPPGLNYQVQHESGRTVIAHRYGGIEVQTSWCVDATQSLKHVSVQLRNDNPWPVRLRLVAKLEWQMGTQRSDRMTVSTRRQSQAIESQELTVLLATQDEHSQALGGGTAFLACLGSSQGPPGWTCDRREFFDLQGLAVLPDVLGQRAGVGLDPCAALSYELELAVDSSVHHSFVLGYAATQEDAAHLAEVAVSRPVSEREELVLQEWDRLLGATTVRTPDPLFDVMVNRWLLTQVVTSRLRAKAGFYQAGGATGFRDQLQDAMALVWADPARLRGQLVLCASRQFEAGDVQHWWHAPDGAGVRTHFSDDLLWLPYATQHYLLATDDQSVLEEAVTFLQGMAIPAGADDIYATPSVSSGSAALYEHCARTIDHSLRVGSHGLPLMGCGDWNDGMNRVGHLGRGESVWLGWFLCGLVQAWIPLAQRRGDSVRVERWNTAALGWRRALQTEAWDGAWFKRAFFDDGSPLGANTNTEARLDLMAQAWAVLSGVASEVHQLDAMHAVHAHLVDADNGLIRLLDPPLVQATPRAGYIQSYPPGVRENGGQYNHAAVWALMAQAQLLRDLSQDDPRRNIPYEYFTYISAAHRASHAQYGAAYGLEPYVLAGDVCSHEPYVGRGGWSWYTGAAGWLHRAAVESIFGLTLRAHCLSLAPCLPVHWPVAELTLRRGDQVLHVVVVRADADTALHAARMLTTIGSAQLLLVQQILDWRAWPGESCWVVPLLGRNPSVR